MCVVLKCCASESANFSHLAKNHSNVHSYVRPVILFHQCPMENNGTCVTFTLTFDCVISFQAKTHAITCVFPFPVHTLALTSFETHTYKQRRTHPFRHLLSHLHTLSLFRAHWENNVFSHTYSHV